MADAEMAVLKGKLPECFFQRSVHISNFIDSGDKPRSIGAQLYSAPERAGL